MSAHPQIVAIGQFPPPMTGFSHITACVADMLSQRFEVVRYDIAPPKESRALSKHLMRMAATAHACLGLISAFSAGARTSYVACEGGLGLLYTIAVVSLARILGYRILLHHHSFKYIDVPSLPMRAVLAVGGGLTHIFLCPGMRDRFEAQYHCATQALILSNAAFVAAQTPTAAPPSNEAVVLGHLSNLTREKGLYLFLDLLRAAVEAGLNVRGVLAGPTASTEDAAAIEAARVALAGKLDYRGPLYGAAKDQFYRDIDVFVFPTCYANEAQPTVLFEAAAAGNRIVAYDRGCISAQVNTLGLVVSRDGEFAAAALDWLRRSEVDGDRPARAAEVERWYAANRTAALDVADQLVSICLAPDDPVAEREGARQ
ncbi:glycosyltransferase family 4 protein [Xanthobacter aminoxidans]|uniref:glycosyltransferase family 4 protein n=1 Tax=Xanthobacter aminoxidans TaxID=186280 RepID=UPI00372A7287